MPHAAVKFCANCLVFAPELALHYGNTPYMERRAKPDSEFLAALPRHVQDYEEAARYAPNLVFIGALSPEELAERPQGLEPQRDGPFGELMPEDEFLGLMDLCDVFDLIWLTEAFAGKVRARLEARDFWTVEQLARLEKGRAPAKIEAEIREREAAPLYFQGQLAGCCRRGHETDENLSAHVLLENIASKATSVLALMHLLKKSGLTPLELDFVVECSEEAVGDMNQRGGGNLAKAVAESAGCRYASGFDVRAFCAGPVAALISSAAMVASGVHRNVAVVAGGAVPKLYMNARDHVKKGLPALENCLGAMAVLLTPEDGESPVLRLDSIGKHNVGDGASPQAVTTALAWEPLERLGLKLTDVDKYAPELHNPEVTLPAGAGNVPEANYKMIAALGVMKKQLERGDIEAFVRTRGMVGFAPTQGHIPSGVPYMGHALVAMKQGRLKRVMIIGKGSLFLGRLTNLADGASFLLEKMPAVSPTVTSQDLEALLPVGLMTVGSELDQVEILEGGREAQAEDPRLRVVAIGPRRPGYEDLDWLETDETGLIQTMETALSGGRIRGAVALHYPFPMGVTTIGRVITPARGRPLLLASTTGAAAAQTGPALVLNAVLGRAVARSLGLHEPTLGILNIGGAGQALRALTALKEAGYPLSFGASGRVDGGVLLRGNDLLNPAVDICLCDSLTGNVLMKIFGSFSTGGAYEALGWGYGPSVGSGWRRVVSIISRASGAPVVAGALKFTVAAIRGGLPEKVAEEMAAAEKAGLAEVLATLAPAPTAEEGAVEPPPARPTEEEIPGVDVLDIEAAVICLWRAGLYAESAMGCTGPVVRVPRDALEAARGHLKRHNFI